MPLYQTQANNMSQSYKNSGTLTTPQSDRMPTRHACRQDFETGFRPQPTRIQTADPRGKFSLGAAVLPVNPLCLTYRSGVNPPRTDRDARQAAGSRSGRRRSEARRRSIPSTPTPPGAGRRATRRSQASPSVDRRLQSDN
jgi:hypothetical protein